MKSQVIKWGDAVYRIQRDSSGVGVFVFKKVGTFADGATEWEHLFSKEGEREARSLLERLAMETLGLTESKQIDLG